MTSQFQQYQSGALDGKDAKSIVTNEPEVKVIEMNEFQNKALRLVQEDFNKTFFPNADKKAELRDFYVVWFAKVLGNWKALVSTDLVSGQYWELTYDGNKKQTYVDHYVKRTNHAVTDEEYANLS